MKKTNRLLLRLASLVIVFSLAGWLTACNQLPKGAQQALEKVVKKPTVAINNIAVTNFNLNNVDLLMDLKVSNPNAVKLALAGYDYTIKLNDQQLIQGKTEQGFSVQAFGSNSVKVPLSISFNDLAKLYKSMGKSNQVNYDAKMNLRLDAPLLNMYNIKTGKQGQITVPKIPDVCFGSIRVKKFSFTRVQLEVDMEVDNPNDFAMNLSDIDYRISMGNSAALSGKVAKNLAIKAKGKSKLTIPVSASLADLGSSMISALRNGKFSNFTVDANLTLDSPAQGFKKMRIPIHYTP